MTHPGGVKTRERHLPFTTPAKEFRGRSKIDLDSEDMS
jgi:hypothetical protein